jgi:retron-type reverse transcriptase
MSRRDDGGARASASRRSLPAGASPASVSAGAPSSRPQTCGESRAGQAGCHEPLRREPARGPQHHVKPAASTHSQSESRAAHVTAKAMSTALQSGDAHVVGLGGVQGAARVHGGERNTRGPSARPLSRQHGSYKPAAKASVAQRESEGTVVVTRPATNNAGGAKGPCGGNVGSASTRKGMTGKTESNHPGGRESIDHVRQLQRRLWSAAKRQPGRRFHALLDRIYRRDVLWEAWRRVKKNRGAAGVDAMTLAAVEQLGVEAFLEDLGARLQAGTYQPSAVRRRYIPKADGRTRPLGIPTVRDRVAQMAATLILEPIFEADFQPCSYGFRPKRNATQALETLRTRGARGGNHVLDADIRDYFGSIDHDKLMRLVERRISDRRVLKLLRQWLRAGVMEDGHVTATVAGTPQGGVISPLLSNIFLHVLDTVWMRRYAHLGVLVRYADDCARPKPLLLRDERSPHHEYPKSVSSLGPGATGQPVPSKQDRHNVLEGSAMCGVVRSPGTETNLQAAIAMNDRCAPVSVYPAVIAARAGTGVAEPPVVGRRLLSMVDELGMRTHRGSRGEGGSMQGQSRGVRLETPPGPPMLAVETEDIRPEAEVPTEAWVGSRRGSYERRRRVMPLEQRAPTSVTLAREGRTA